MPQTPAAGTNKSRQLDELMRLNGELAEALGELAQRNDELDALNRQRNEFLGMAAHDLRNPLAVILGYSEDPAGDQPH